MTADRYTVARLDVLPSRKEDSGSEWLQVRRHFDIGSFGVNAWRANAGVRLIGEHTESGTTAAGHEELYVVVEGRATFTLDGEEIDAPAGTLVFARDPAVRRGAVAQEDGTTVLVVGGSPGKAFRISAWEAASDAWAAYEAKDYERAIEVSVAVIEQYPDAAGLIYNLACYESLAGRKEDAVGHLVHAAELDERLLEAAQTDSDLDGIRDDPRFPSGETVPAS